MYCWAWSCGPSVNPKACKPSLLHSSDWASETTTSLRLVFHIFTCQLWGCFQGFQQIPIWDLCPTGKGCTLASVWGSLQDIRLQLGGAQPSVPLLPGCLYLQSHYGSCSVQYVYFPALLSSSGSASSIYAYGVNSTENFLYTGVEGMVLLWKLQERKLRVFWLLLCSPSEEIFLGSMTWASHPVVFCSENLE